jgi:hypothetical protein
MRLLDLKSFQIPDDAKRMSYENMKNLLSNDGLLEVIEDMEQAKILINNKPYAFLTLAGDELIVHFIQPRNLTGLRKKLSYYSELENPRGWLEFRTYADNNYEDQIRADLGSFIGQTLCELTLFNNPT